MPSYDKLQRVYRLRIALFLVIIFLAVPVSVILFEGIVTLRQLGVIERERDKWQRPAEVLQALAVKAGGTVADIGCGSGYFTLKLSAAVGSGGHVWAVDIRRESLIFLWLRTLALRDRNVSIIHGQTDDTKLETSRLNAALISNTYHELAKPGAILNQTYQALRRGGRVVVVDRGPGSARETRQIEMHHHELAMHVAEEEICRAGFEIIHAQDVFIDRPGDSPWWLIIAKKP